jgi:hypothetical protein
MANVFHIIAARLRVGMEGLEAREEISAPV